MLAAIYVRVSTTKRSQKDSPEHQEGICREKARQMGLETADSLVYEDRDSGTNIVGRPAIRRLIRDAQARSFEAVLFASLSRFSRDTMDSLALKRMLVDTLGVRLISLDEGYDSAIDRDELKFQIISAVNQKLSEQISLSAKRGIRQSALKGNFTGSVAPYGYRKAMEGDKKTMVPEQAEADIVRLIYKLYTADRMGEKAIADYLNGLFIPSAKGGTWSVTSIQKLLQNEAYTGVNVFSKYESKLVYNDIDNLSDRKKRLIQRDRRLWERAHQPVTHEAIIDGGLFELAQRVRLQRGGGGRGGIRRKVNVLAGHIHCRHCGSAMVCVKAGKRHDLACSRRRRHGTAGCANGFRLPYEPFRDELLALAAGHVRAAATDGDWLAGFRQLLQQHGGTAADGGVPLAPEHAAEVAAAAERDRLRDALEEHRRLLYSLRREHMLGRIDDEQYLFEKVQYEQAIVRTTDKLAAVGSAAEIIIPEAAKVLSDDQVLEHLLQWDDSDPGSFERLRYALMKLIASITVDNDGNVEVVFTYADPNG